MKTTDKILAFLLPLYTVVATGMVWILIRLSRQVVTNDSAWQALDAGGASREHLFAEGIHQMAFLLPGFLVTSFAVVVLFFIGRKQKTHNQPSDATR